MVSQDTVQNTDAAKTPRSSKTLNLILGTIAILLIAWTYSAYSHNIPLQNYVINLIRTSLSTLRVTLIVSFGGTLLSIPFLARRSHKRKKLKAPAPPSTVLYSAKVHPLMMTPRPARDSGFVIRKTIKRGRISRNRAGERLPPSDVLNE